MPSMPVHAFAQPLFTTIALARPDDTDRLRRDTVTGAACARLMVNTPAAEAVVSETISARSSPDALIPHDTPAARNPFGVVTLPSTGTAEMLLRMPLMQAPRVGQRRQRPEPGRGAAVRRSVVAPQPTGRHRSLPPAALAGSSPRLAAGESPHTGRSAGTAGTTCSH